MAEQKSEQPKPERKSLWNFLNSAVGLLLITSLITSGLVPYFQRKHQEGEWKRQLRADNLKYRLEMMRNCLKEFTQANTYTSQGYGLFQAVQDRTPLTASDYRAFQEQLRTVLTNRLQQNARVLGLTAFFRDQAGVEKAHFEYTRLATDYLATVREYLNLKYRVSSLRTPLPLEDPTRQSLERLEAQGQNLSEVTLAYSACVTKLTQEIGKEEQRYEKADF